MVSRHVEKHLLLVFVWIRRGALLLRRRRIRQPQESRTAQKDIADSHHINPAWRPDTLHGRRHYVFAHVKMYHNLPIDRLIP